jgi:hypothetical protein
MGFDQPKRGIFTKNGAFKKPNKDLVANLMGISSGKTWGMFRNGDFTHR